MTKPTFFSVAKRPKWIFGLLFALAAAAVFALLGQWQLDRTFTVVEPAEENEQVFVLNQIATPGAALTAEAANVLVSANIMLDQSNVYIVSNRLQETNDGIVSGYWLIANSGALLSDNDTTGSLTVAMGFSESVETIEAAREELQASMLPQAFLESTGRYLQTEAPVELPDQSKPYLLGSLSLAQLVNLYSSDQVESFAGFLALDAEPGLGLAPIILPAQQVGTSVNWLTLFYAVEWVLFGIFAVFLWWRLVQDQRLRESTKTTT
jgi:cytochrome oxidase assembly protein ShyY1